MELTDIIFSEATEINEYGKLIRFKKAKFKVNGGPHSLKISMPDFEAGKARSIIEREAAKIDAVFSGKK
jgi:hypothetical protein